MLNKPTFMLHYIFLALFYSSICFYVTTDSKHLYGPRCIDNAPQDFILNVLITFTLLIFIQPRAGNHRCKLVLYFACRGAVHMHLYYGIPSGQLVHFLTLLILTCSLQLSFESCVMLRYLPVFA